MLGTDLSLGITCMKYSRVLQSGRGKSQRFDVSTAKEDAIKIELVTTSLIDSTMYALFASEYIVLRQRAMRKSYSTAMRRG